MARNNLFLLGVVVVVLILALFVTSKGLRENLTGVQTITISDVQNGTPAYDQVAFKVLPIANSLGITDPNVVKTAVIVIAESGQIYTQATSVPTKDQFVNLLSQGSTPTFAQLPSSDQSAVSIAYEYYFGSSAPAPSPPSSSTPSNAGYGTPVCPSGSTSNAYGGCNLPSTPGGDPMYTSPTSCSTGTLVNIPGGRSVCAVCPSGTTATLGASGPVCTSGSTTPSPASSSSSSPAPTSCTPAYTSIPGGTMEYKCFT